MRDEVKNRHCVIFYFSGKLMKSAISYIIGEYLRLTRAPLRDYSEIR